MYTYLQLRTLAAISALSPRTGNFAAKGWQDREEGEVTVATVVWAAIGITIAVGAGALIYTKVTKKATDLDLDQPIK